MNRYAANDKAPILGPCPCHDCGQPLWWARRKTRDGGGIPLAHGRLEWREWTGRIHYCPVAKTKIRRARKAA